MNLPAHVITLLPDFNLVPIPRRHTRGGNAADARAQYEHAFRCAGAFAKQMRLGQRQLLKLGAHHRVLHASDVLFPRQPVVAHIARNATAYRRFDVSKRLFAPVRVGVERAAQ